MEILDIKTIVMNSINAYLMPSLDVLDTRYFSGSIEQSFVPFSSYISDGYLYCSGTLQVNILPFNLNTTISTDRLDWYKVLSYQKCISFQTITIQVIGNGIVGISDGYFNCKINNIDQVYSLAYHFDSNTVAVLSYNLEEVLFSELPKISVDIVGRPRIVSKYLSGNMLVEDLIELGLFSNYPVELDMMHSIIEKCIVEDLHRFQNIICIYPMSHTAITPTARGTYTKSLRLGCLHIT